MLTLPPHTQFFTFGDKHPKGPPEVTGKMVYSPSLDHISLAAAEGASLRVRPEAEAGPMLPR